MTRGLWSLAGIVGGASAGLILADRAAAPRTAAPPAFVLPPLAAEAHAPPLAAIAIPPEFGPTPGQPPLPAALAPADPVPAPTLAPTPAPPAVAAVPPEKPTPAAVRPPIAAPDPTPPAETILISVAERRLRVILADGSTRSFPIAVGRSRDLIPIGTTEVVRKRRNPTWVPTPNMRRKDPTLPAAVPPGPRNPMGRHALDLGWTYYRIHGTNEPQSIGRAASSGCFRMLPKDIEAVYGLVGVGTKVTVIEGRLPPPSALPETRAL